MAEFRWDLADADGPCTLATNTAITCPRCGEWVPTGEVARLGLARSYPTFGEMKRVIAEAHHNECCWAGEGCCR